MSTRVTYLTPMELFRLDRATAMVERAYHWDSVGIFLVGSALARRDFRDVDVRMMLHDASFDAMFDDASGEDRWSLLCVAFSTLLREESGLPVDFQIQRMSDANALHAGHRRHGLGLVPRYPGESPMYLATRRRAAALADVQGLPDQRVDGPEHADGEHDAADLGSLRVRREDVDGGTKQGEDERPDCDQHEGRSTTEPDS